MKNSLRSRRGRTVVGGSVLALALGGPAAAAPARASTPPGCIFSACTPVTWVPAVSDSLNPGGVTAPDAILTCATSSTTISGAYSLAIPVGCLTLYNGEWVTVTWTSPQSVVAGQSVTMELSQQTDGNLVLTVTGDGGKLTRQWASGTTFAGNPAGPGCLARFQSSADLVVEDCNGTSIWNSGAHTDADALLAFQSGGDLVIDESSAGTALWASQTNLTTVPTPP